MDGDPHRYANAELHGQAPRAVMLIGVGYLVDENERTEKKEEPSI